MGLWGEFFDLELEKIENAAIQTAQGVLLNRMVKAFNLNFMKDAQSSEGRPDDDPEVFKTRLEAYNRQTAPLLPYYQARGCLSEIDGMGSVDFVAAEIDAVLQRCQAAGA